jgi:hypothetical protein
LDHTILKALTERPTAAMIQHRGFSITPTDDVSVSRSRSRLRERP